MAVRSSNFCTCWLCWRSIDSAVERGEGMAMPVPAAGERGSGGWSGGEVVPLQRLSVGCEVMERRRDEELALGSCRRRAECVCLILECVL